MTKSILTVLCYLFVVRCGKKIYDYYMFLQVPGNICVISVVGDISLINYFWRQTFIVKWGIDLYYQIYWELFKRTSSYILEFDSYPLHGQKYYVT